MTKPSFLTDDEYDGLIANGKLPVGQKDAFPGIFIHWGDQRWFLHEIIPDDHNLALAIHYPNVGMMDLVRVPLDMLDSLRGANGEAVERGQLGRIGNDRPSFLTQCDWDRLVANGLRPDRDRTAIQPVVRVFVPGTKRSWLLTEVFADDHNQANSIQDLGHGTTHWRSVPLDQLGRLKGPDGQSLTRDNKFTCCNIEQLSDIGAGGTK